MEPRRVGPYRLERKLGAGGMGVVYAAWDERLERRVALKQIRPEGADDPRRRDRFRREARAVAQLDHPAIVRIYAAGAPSTRSGGLLGPRRPERPGGGDRRLSVACWIPRWTPI